MTQQTADNKKRLFTIAQLAAAPPASGATITLTQVNASLPIGSTSVINGQLQDVNANPGNPIQNLELLLDGVPTAVDATTYNTQSFLLQNYTIDVTTFSLADEGKELRVRLTDSGGNVVLSDPVALDLGLYVDPLREIAAHPANGTSSANTPWSFTPANPTWSADTPVTGYAGNVQLNTSSATATYTAVPGGFPVGLDFQLDLAAGATARITVELDGVVEDDWEFTNADITAPASEEDLNVAFGSVYVDQGQTITVRVESVNGLVKWNLSHMPIGNQLTGGASPAPPPDPDQAARITRSKDYLTDAGYVTSLGFVVTGLSNAHFYNSYFHITSHTQHWLQTFDAAILTQIRTLIDGVIAGTNVTTLRDGAEAGDGVRPTTARGATQTSYLGWSGPAMLDEFHFAVATLRLCFEVIDEASTSVADKIWATNTSNWVNLNIVEKAQTGSGAQHGDMNRFADSAATGIFDSVGNSTVSAGYWNDKIILGVTASALHIAINSITAQTTPTYYTTDLDASGRPRVDWKGWFRAFAGLDTANVPTGLGGTAEGMPRTNAAVIDGNGNINWDVANTNAGSNHNTNGQEDTHGPGVNHTGRVADMASTLVRVGPTIGLTIAEQIAAANIVTALRATLTRVLIQQGGRLYGANYLSGSNAEFRSGVGWEGPDTVPPTRKNAGMESQLCLGWQWLLKDDPYGNQFAELLIDAGVEDFGKSGTVTLSSQTKYGNHIVRKHAFDFALAALSAALV